MKFKYLIWFLVAISIVSAGGVFFSPGSNSYAKTRKIRFFTDLDASWTVDKGSFARTCSIEDSISVPLELSWKKKIARSIGATPSAADEFIFVSTRDRRIVILQRDSGERMARRTFKGGFGGSVLIRGLKMFFNTRVPDGKVYSMEINSKHKHIQRKIGPAVVSPILVQDQLFLFNQYGKVLCLNPEVGYRNWEHKIKGKIEYAPVFLDPYLYIPTIGGVVYKLDSATGVEICKTAPANGLILGDLSSDGNHIFGALSDGRIFSLEPDSLKKEWEVKLEHEFFSGPVYSERALYLCSRDGWLIKLSARNGELIWKAKLGGVTVAAPSITGELAFTGTKSGDMAAFDTQSGERLWYRKINEGISASPLIYRDFVYYCSDKGTVYAFHPK